MDNSAQDNQNLQNTQQPFPTDDISNTMAPPPPPVIDGNVQTDGTSGTEPSFISPKPKTGINGKLIGAIFGILILAAAVGAGTYLVQQQQELREKAGESCTNPGKCGTGYTNSCNVGERCYDRDGNGLGICITTDPSCNPQTPVPTLTPSNCDDGTDCTTRKEYILYKCPNKFGLIGNAGCQDIQVRNTSTYERPFCGTQQIDACLDSVDCNPWEFVSSDEFRDNCTESPRPGATPTPPGGGGCGASCTNVSQCNIPGAGNPACSNGVCWDAAVCGGVTPPPVTCQDSVTCQDGTVCSPGQECRFASGDGYWYCGQRKDCATPTPHPTATPGPIGASCKNIKAFDANWNKLDAVALAGLNAGDVVRFTVRGESLEGDFTKARFTFNGQLQPVTRQTRPDVPKEFYTEYVIPNNVTQFTIGAEVYHNIKDKWF